MTRGRWTDETREFAKKLYLGGDSASEVSRQLLRVHKLSVSRNAVIGIMHRMGVASDRRRGRISAGHYTPPKPKPNGGLAAVNAVRKVERLERDKAALEAHPLPKAVPVPAGSRGLVLTALSARMCRFVLDDPGQGRMDQALFCAAGTAEGETYCCDHARIAGIRPERIGNAYARGLRKFYA